MENFNHCRAQCFEAFRQTLSELHDKLNVTEVLFRDAWLEKLQNNPTLFASGWYDPPPYGLSVLFTSDKTPDRISFESLRQEKFWPGAGKTDWNGFLFAYSSCVSRQTGILGDFDVTLYFGSDPALKKHYRNCFDATDELLRSISPSDTSGEIFKRSEEIFADANLKNCVISITDVTLLDLGHTFPSLSPKYFSDPPHELSVEDKNTLRASRKFLNNVTDWPLEEGMQFSIEPQLRSTSDPSLPQISFHYLLQRKNNQIHICRDIDELIKPLL